MPKTLLIACVVVMGALLAKAGIAPFYETGFARYTTPALAAALILLVALFMARKRWTWHYVRSMAIMFPTISFIFPPTPEFFGALTRAGQAIALVEGLGCLAILGCVLRAETRSWFFATRADEVSPA